MSDVQVVPELLLSAYMIVAGVLLLVGRKRITLWCEWWMRLCRLPAGARFGIATSWAGQDPALRLTDYECPYLALASQIQRESATLTFGWLD